MRQVRQRHGGKVARFESFDAFQDCSLETFTTLEIKYSKLGIVLSHQ